MIKRFEEADIETIEARTGSSADEFFMEIFQAWDGIDSSDILDLMTEALSNIDVDLTYDEIEEDDDDDSFEDDDEDEDDDFDDDEEEYEESFDD
ncbi:MAG: hypothetical protein R3E66_09115 [bacterium]